MKQVLSITKVKLATLVEGDPKGPFSIATTPRCRGGHFSIPWIALLYPWSLPYNAYNVGGPCSVMVIVLGNGHDDTSSNPGWDWLHLT